MVAYFTPSISGVSTPVFFTRLVYMSALLIVVGYLWAYISTRGITLLREARVLRHQVGQVFEERFKVVNRCPLPDCGWKSEMNRHCRGTLVRACCR
jgi:hypothetical protein